MSHIFIAAARVTAIPMPGGDYPAESINMVVTENNTIAKNINSTESISVGITESSGVTDYPASSESLVVAVTESNSTSKITAIGRTPRGTTLSKTSGTTLQTSAWTPGSSVSLVVFIATDDLHTGYRPFSVTMYKASDNSAITTLTYQGEAISDNNVRISVYTFLGLVGIDYNIYIKTAWSASIVCRACSIWELTNVGAVGTPVGASGSSGSPNSGNYTVTDINMLLLGGICMEGPAGDTGITYGSGFTQEQATATSGGADDSNIILYDAYRVPPTTGDYACGGTGATSRDWVAILVPISGT